MSHLWSDDEDAKEDTTIEFDVCCGFVLPSISLFAVYFPTHSACDRCCPCACNDLDKKAQNPG